MTMTLAPIRLRTNIYKGCEKCGGVLRLERDCDSLLDADAADYVCLQCGRRAPVVSVTDNVALLQRREVKRW